MIITLGTRGRVIITLGTNELPRGQTQPEPKGFDAGVLPFSSTGLLPPEISEGSSRPSLVVGDYHPGAVFSFVFRFAVVGFVGL